MRFVNLTYCDVESTKMASMATKFVLLPSIPKQDFPYDRKREQLIQFMNTDY